MENILIKLYRNIYAPPELAELMREIDDCHRQLIEVLGKSERRLVLKIIDAQNHVSDEIAEDSFIFGFKLATQLAHELKKYDGHLRSEQNADEDVRRSIMSEEEN